jgi:hypothetical protein
MPGHFFRLRTDVPTRWTCAAVPNVWACADQLYSAVSVWEKGRLFCQMAFFGPVSHQGFAIRHSLLSQFVHHRNFHVFFTILYPVNHTSVIVVRSTSSNQYTEPSPLRIKPTPTRYQQSGLVALRLTRSSHTPVGETPICVAISTQ